jgi:D-tyrosyl-tRNA(Tyr) deacylase
MRAVVQRVFRARVDVDGSTVGAIERGLVAFIGAGRQDDEGDAKYLAAKVAGLRVFEDDRGKMSRSVLEVGGAVLCISQFTLFGDMRRGRRPSFDEAMEPVRARKLFDDFVMLLREQGAVVATGRFGAMMRVVVDNDGPVTILMDSRKSF